MPRRNLARLVTALVLTTCVLLNQLAFASPLAAETKGCNFLAPFGPDPAPNWKITFARADDGIGFRVHHEIADNAAYLAEVLTAVDTWNAMAEAIDLRYLGPTSTIPETGSPNDGENVIGPNSSLPASELGRASVAGTNRALEFDIALNFDATVPIGIAEPGTGVADLQSIIAHELGHVFGLDHTKTGEQLMRSTLTAGNQVHRLGDEDRRCVEAIYGSLADPAATPPADSPDDATGAIDGASDPVETIHTVSCLDGKGRVDTNIVNVDDVPARYRVEFAELSPRQRVVADGDWWRMSISGRADGDYRVLVMRNGWIVSSETVSVRCDAGTPATSEGNVQVVNACRDDDGYVLFQFTNPSPQPRSWVIEVADTRNRTTSAAPWGAAVRAVTGRPDGTHEVLIRSGGVVTSFAVTVDCD